MRLRILTYNIHKCIGGLDRRYRPERVRDVIAHYEPDVVLLQEVDSGARRSNRDHQIDLLGEELGLRHRAWFENHSLRSGGGYGNGVLSRFAIEDRQNIDITIGPFKRRSILHVRCRIPADGADDGGHTRTLHVYNGHLGLTGLARGVQLRRFLASEPLARLHQRTPVVFGGDFNDVWGTLGKSFLAPAGFRSTERPRPTFPAFAPLRALDAVYVRGDLELEVLYRSRLRLARAASDHLPLVADLRIVAAPDGPPVSSRP